MDSEIGNRVKQFYRSLLQRICSIAQVDHHPTGGTVWNTLVDGKGWIAPKISRFPAQSGRLVEKFFSIRLSPSCEPFVDQNLLRVYRSPWVPAYANRGPGTL